MSVRKDLDFTPPALREVSLRVAKVNGVNLGQGICLTPTPTQVIEAAEEAMRNGFNRYGPAQGIPELREAIANKLNQFNSMRVTAENVLITSGATGAFESVCQALLDVDDEVVLFRPFYPYHRNAVLRARGRLRFCDLNPPDWTFDLSQFESCLTARTKLVVLSNPNNPTGRVFTREELLSIGNCCKERGIWCVTDEVYEYLTYDGHEHLSLGSVPEMFDHVITMGSYSKTFSITGWRIGYLVAPTSVFSQFRAVSDQVYVCAPTPFQHAVARSIRELPVSYYSNLLSDYVEKRSLMESALKNAGFTMSRPQGSYYYLVDTAQGFPGETAESVLDRMISVCGVGGVPTSDFFGPEVRGDPKRDRYLRFCFSVPNSMLHDAAQRLERLS